LQTLVSNVFNHVINQEDAKLVHFITDGILHNFRKHLIVDKLNQGVGELLVSLEENTNKLCNCYLQLLFNIIIILEKLEFFSFAFFLLLS